jgi:hypothetical protein
MEDLIQNAHTLFGERSSPTPPAPSSHVAETTSTLTYGSLLLSPELPQPAEVQAMDSTTRHRPVIVGANPTSTQSSFSSYPSEVVAVRPTSVAEWRLQVSQSRQPEALTIPRGPPESLSVLSSTSNFPLSSATSLQTRMGRLS